MKKFLIGGVSLFAILSASNAFAAGYTCEELIEYTSCNAGYYLSGGAVAPECPDGYDWAPFVSDWEEAYMGWNSEEDFLNDCAESGFTDGDECWYRILGTGCYKNWECEECEDTWQRDFIPMSASGGTDCVTCPVGSTCAGGTADAVECPAGSYCAAAGLSQPTGLCAQNTWSIAGSSECEPCPATNLTDKDGKTVIAKTSGKGSTSASACFIDPNAYFKDDTGVFHFKSNCEYTSLTPGIQGGGGGNVVTPVDKEARCAELGGNLETFARDDYDEGTVTESFCVKYLDSIPETEQACDATDSCYWEEGDCYCDCDGTWIVDMDTGAPECLSSGTWYGW